MNQKFFFPWPIWPLNTKSWQHWCRMHKVLKFSVSWQNRIHHSNEDSKHNFKVSLSKSSVSDQAKTKLSQRPGSRTLDPNVFVLFCSDFLKREQQELSKAFYSFYFRVWKSFPWANVMLEEEGKNKTKTTKAKLLKAKARFTLDIFVEMYKRNSHLQYCSQCYQPFWSINGKLILCAGIWLCMYLCRYFRS